MSRFKEQYQAIKDAKAAYGAGEKGKGPREDIDGYLSALEGYGRIMLYMPHICGKYVSMQIVILCYALALEHRRNGKLRKKLHELKQARRAEVNRLQRENAALWAERTNAQFMDMVKGGLCHGGISDHD